MKPGLTMIELARLSGVPRTTLRFYERRGLLPPPRRTVGNYRLYDPSAAVRIRFTKRAQELGFTLVEIAAFLAAADGPPPKGAVLARFGAEKIEEIDRKIRDLKKMQKAISSRIASSANLEKACPILASLGGTEDDEAPASRGGMTLARERRTAR